MRSHLDAERYIERTIWSQYEAHGYGMYVVEAPTPRVPMGLCGLVKRDFLESPDLGFALFPEWVGKGYAAEAAHAVIAHAADRLGIARLYAIVNAGNRRSIALLERLHFRHEGRCVIPPAGPEVERYVRDAPG